MSTLNRARRQASLEALVQYGPQASVLAAALRDARSQRKTEIRGAQGADDQIQQLLQQTKPQIGRDYANVDHVVKSAQGDLFAHLAGLGSAATPYEAAARREESGRVSRLAESRRQDLGEIHERGISSRFARASGIAQANSAYGQRVGQIRSSMLDLAKQQGAFEAAAVGDIMQKAAELASEEKRARMSMEAQLRSAGIRAGASVETARIGAGARVKSAKISAAARGKSAAGKGKARKNAVTHSQSGAAVSQIQRVAALVHENGPSSHLRSWLLTGKHIPARTVTLRGKKVKLPAVSIPRISNAGPVSSKTLINAGFDIAAFGVLSHPNRVALQGVHVPGAWKSHWPISRSHTGR